MAAAVADNHQPGSTCRTQDARRPGAPRQCRENKAYVCAGAVQPPGAAAKSVSDSVGRVDQLRKLGPDAPLPRPFDRSGASRLAVCDRPDVAVGRMTAVDGA